MRIVKSKIPHVITGTGQNFQSVEENVAKDLKRENDFLKKRQMDVQKRELKKWNASVSIAHAKINSQDLMIKSESLSAVKKRLKMPSDQKNYKPLP